MSNDIFAAMFSLTPRDFNMEFHTSVRNDENHAHSHPNERDG